MSSSYIVSFKKDTPDSVIDAEIAKVEASGATIKDRYRSAIKGFSVEVPDSIVNSLSFDQEHVNFVEADGEVTTQGQSLISK
ncbi:hypothetical protein BDF14DRAFT_1881890 [Spinellus fusiger]|nr:hypothetical protein BDF14DRAFT_1881890 [Spinellus fusiger]